MTSQQVEVKQLRKQRNGKFQPSEEVEVYQLALNTNKARKRSHQFKARAKPPLPRVKPVCCQRSMLSLYYLDVRTRNKVGYICRQCGRIIRIGTMNRATATFRRLKNKEEKQT